MYRTTFFLMRGDNYSPEIYAIKHCNRPASTKAYKNLVRMFERGEISSYGWKRTPNITRVMITPRNENEGKSSQLGNLNKTK